MHTEVLLLIIFLPIFIGSIFGVMNNRLNNSEGELPEETIKSISWEQTAIDNGKKKKGYKN